MNPSTTRPPRAKKLTDLDRLEIDRVASDLVVNYGSLILQDAIRYSHSRPDAEDAYQRSLEILLTKAPTSDPAQLVPWLRTVVRNEALAIAKSRHNANVELTHEHSESLWSDETPPDSMVESVADLEIGAEALRDLSDDQVRCLIAHSAGLNYDEISEITGFTRRKVTRCLERGRMTFARRVEAIAAGSECERMQPLIHRVLAADPEAAIELRPHLRHCLACRTRLRTYDDASRNIAVLFPPSLVVVGHQSRGFLTRLANWWHSVGDRITIQLVGADRWVEASGVKKVGLVAALAAASTGGGLAVHTAVEHQHQLATPRARVASEHARSEPPTASLVDPIELTSRSRTSARAHRVRRRSADVKPRLAPRSAPISAPADSPATRTVDDGSAEFAPEGAASP